MATGACEYATVPNTSWRNSSYPIVPCSVQFMPLPRVRRVQRIPASGGYPRHEQEDDPSPAKDSETKLGYYADVGGTPQQGDEPRRRREWRDEKRTKKRSLLPLRQIHSRNSPSSLSPPQVDVLHRLSPTSRQSDVMRETGWLVLSRDGGKRGRTAGP